LASISRVNHRTRLRTLLERLEVDVHRPKRSVALVHSSLSSIDQTSRPDRNTLVNRVADRVRVHAMYAVRTDVRRGRRGGDREAAPVSRLRRAAAGRIPRAPHEQLAQVVGDRPSHPMPVTRCPPAGRSPARGVSGSARTTMAAGISFDAEEVDRLRHHGPVSAASRARGERTAPCASQGTRLANRFENQRFRVASSRRRRRRRRRARRWCSDQVRA